MGTLREEHADEVIRFQTSLRDLEGTCSNITRAQFEKLYSERARAIRKNIERDFERARRDFLTSNPDVSEDELKAVLSENYEAIADDPDNLNFELFSDLRDYMSIMPPSGIRSLVDNYRSRRKS